MEKQWERRIDYRNFLSLTPELLDVLGVRAGDIVVLSQVGDGKVLEIRRRDK